MKKIDLTRSLYDLTGEYPELTGILKDLGFLGVGNFAMRNTVGRVTTIPQGCVKLGKDITGVIAVLREKGFVVEGSGITG